MKSIFAGRTAGRSTNERPITDGTRYYWMYGKAEVKTETISKEEIGSEKNKTETISKKGVRLGIILGWISIIGIIILFAILSSKTKNSKILVETVPVETVNIICSVSIPMGGSDGVITYDEYNPSKILPPRMLIHASAEIGNGHIGAHVVSGTDLSFFYRHSSFLVYGGKNIPKKIISLTETEMVISWEINIPRSKVFKFKKEALQRGVDYSIYFHDDTPPEIFSSSSSFSSQESHYKNGSYSREQRFERGRRVKYLFLRAN